ncbi:MAG: hypothetical protein RJQ04_18685 [Longimicrobiales bacterium]
MIRVVLFLLLAGGLAAYTWWVYTRRELPVRNRRVLAGLRIATFVLILLLLFDPRLPWGGLSGAASRWVLLDVSASMDAPGPDGARPWDEAVARARALEADGWRVVPFGAAVGAGVPDEPVASRTTLAPALERALEAGVVEVRVLTDARVEDPVEVRRVLAASQAPVGVETFGALTTNAGVGSFEVDDAPGRDAPMDARLELFGEGAADSVLLEFREEGRLVASEMVALPAPGLRRRVEATLPAPEAEGRVRYTVRATLPGDAFAADDEAVAYATAGYDEGALVLVSLVPDWEPRYLLPVLETVTGLEAAAWLRVGPDRFLPMGRGEARGGTVDSTAVGRAVAEAALLVVHGLAGDADAWAASLPARAPRALVWPLDAEAAGALGLATGPPRGGEWYAADEVPPSPLAGALAGAAFAGLPPLTDILVQGGQGSAAPPLLLQLGGTGPGEPALVLLRPEGRRLAVPMARGFWRWAARDGSAREAYRRLWSGTAGWLLTPDAAVAVTDVRPTARVFERDAEIRWRTPADRPVRLTVRATEDGSEGPAAAEPVVDTTFEAGGEAGSGTLPPGSYVWEAADADGTVLSEGRFDVARRTMEMAATPTVPDAVDATDRGSGIGSRGPGRPLRTSPWPYLAVLVLLAVEWVGRRRAGLR